MNIDSISLNILFKIDVNNLLLFISKLSFVFFEIDNRLLFVDSLIASFTFEFV